MTEAPVKISRPRPYLIECEWRDGFISVIKLESFRKGCPCAECTNAHGPKEKKPDMGLLTTYKPGMNELKSLRPVGNYAVSPVWGDGHDTGIYTWDDMRKIFENNKLSDEELNKLIERFG